MLIEAAGIEMRCPGIGGKQNLKHTAFTAMLHIAVAIYLFIALVLAPRQFQEKVTMHELKQVQLLSASSTLRPRVACLDIRPR